MRVARTVTLLVMFSLPTSAATASAECAWVLWGHGPWGGQAPMWRPLDGAQTREACMRAHDNFRG